ncbi:hypothetical protein ACP4OV_003669 [Aristida adscensionis]
MEVAGRLPGGWRLPHEMFGSPPAPPEPEAETAPPAAAGPPIRGAPHEFFDGSMGAPPEDGETAWYGGGGFGGVPASANAAAGLPETTVAAGDAEAGERQCAVCLEGYAAGDAVRTMPCAHAFHGGCIAGWLRLGRLCPLCRFALPAEADEEEEQAARRRRRRWTPWS